MASVTSIGHFPFCFAEKAEDGHPVEVWNGSTYFVSYGPNGYGGMVEIKTPSKSSSSQVAVVGIGTGCPVGFTLDQMMQLYWRCKWDTLQFSTDFQARNGIRTVNLSTSSPITSYWPAYYQQLGYNFHHPATIVCGLDQAFRGGQGYGSAVSAGDFNGIPVSFCSDFGYLTYWIVETGVSINLLNEFRGYLVTESSGAKKYYPQMGIAVGSTVWDSGSSCGGEPTGTTGASGVSASANWTGNYIAEIKSRDWNYAPDGSGNVTGVSAAVDKTVYFTLRDSEGIPIINNLAMPGISYHGGSTSASGTYIDATLPNNYDYNP